MHDCPTNVLPKPGDRVDSILLMPSMSCLEDQTHALLNTDFSHALPRWQYLLHINYIYILYRMIDISFKIKLNRQRFNRKWTSR